LMRETRLAILIVVTLLFGAAAWGLSACCGDCHGDTGKPCVECCHVSIDAVVAVVLECVADPVVHPVVASYHAPVPVSFPDPIFQPPETTSRS
jgi:hypothetical protein